MPGKSQQIVAFGLRAKTGRAILVILGGSIEAPEVISRAELTLWNPRVPETLQPFHAVMELPWPKACRAAQKSVRAIQTVTTGELKQRLTGCARANLKVCGVGVVGSAKTELERIGNPHIRAHAAEGQLFREVLEVGAGECGLRANGFTEEQLAMKAQGRLRQTPEALERQLSAFKKIVGSPWRADEKLATLAAWVVLAAARRR